MTEYLFWSFIPLIHDLPKPKVKEKNIYNNLDERQSSTVLVKPHLEVLACNVIMKEKMYYELKKSSRVGRICVVIPADTTRRLSFFSFSKRVNISSSEASSSSLSSNNRFILSIRASSSL